MGFSCEFLFDMGHLGFKSPLRIFLTDFPDPNTNADPEVSLID